MFGKEIIGLCDTGANSTIINEKYLEFLKEKGAKLLNFKDKVRVADGNVHSVKFRTKIAIEINNKLRALEVIIFPIHQNLIFGMDAIDEFGLLEEMLAMGRPHIELSEIECLEIDTEMEDFSGILKPKACTTYVPHELSSEENEKLREIIDSFLVASKDGVLTKTHLIEHDIDTGDETPFRSKSYPMSPPLLLKLQEEVKRLVKREIIEQIHFSEWLNPVICVKKPDDSVRLVLDARGLNKKTKKNAYQIQNINSILASIKTPKYISCLDYTEAFFQVPLNKNSRPKTAFMCPGLGSFQFTRMAMGLSSSAQTLTCLIDQLFGNEFHGEIFPYLDDLLIVSDSYERHLELLKIISDRLRQANIGISPTKCKFMMKRVKYLGMVIDESGISINDEKIRPILDFPAPKSQKQVRSLMGMIGWFRRFVQDFAEMTAPITELTKLEYKHNFTWPTEAQEALDKIKIALTTAPILATADYSKPFTVHCDCSNVAAGGVLTQEVDGIERVIAYMSQKLTAAQQKYHTTEKEMLAVLISIEKFRPWIDSCLDVTIVTDHASLVWLQNFKNPRDRLARWALMLQSFPYKIIHRKGKFHCLPDALSRSYDVELIDVIDEIFLESIHIKEFTNTVDDWYMNARKMSEVEDTDKLVNSEIKFITIDGILYLNKPKGENLEHQDLKICVPKEFRNSVLQTAHDSKESGHPGYWRTFQRINATYFWPNMSNEIKSYVDKCEICKRTKPCNQNTKVPLGKFRDPIEAWHSISCDFMGPFVKSHQRNEHLCVIVDNFSKFVVMKAMPRANTVSLIKFLDERVFSVFGIPKKFTSDNGSVYTSKLFREYLKSLGIEHVLLAVYNPKANNTECVNKVIGSNIRAYIHEKNDHRCWDENLNHIQRCINSSVHTTTKYSPYFVNFGQKLKSHGSQHDIEPKVNNEDTLEENQAKLAIVREKVSENVYKTHLNNKRRYNLRSNQREFEIGQEVWIPCRKQSDKSKHFEKKLNDLRQKAYISDRVGSNTYILIDEKGKLIGKYDAVHITI